MVTDFLLPEFMSSSSLSQQQHIRRVLEPSLRSSHGNSAQLRALFTLLASTRDIRASGHRWLTYVMLDVWYDVYPVLAVYALEALILQGYGSWRDVPGLCCYLRTMSRRGEDHPFIETAVELMIRHFRRCNNNNNTCLHQLRLIAKWVPRETSKKKSWLFLWFVKLWFPSGTKLSTEHRRQFRRIISSASSAERPPRLSALNVVDRLAPMRHVFDRIIFS